MNDVTLAMCAVLEIAQHERVLLRAIEPEPQKKKRKNARIEVPRPAPTRAIAKRLTGVDRGLELLMQKLASHGIVSGVRGPGGGHRLARKESEITLRHIHEAVDKPNFAEVCDPLAPNIPDRVQWIVDVAQRAEMNTLERWTVTSMLDEIETLEAIAKQPAPQCPIPADAYGSDDGIDF